MQIEHITTHLLDPSQKLFLPGTAETDLSASSAYAFVSTKLLKLFSADQRHAGAFLPASRLAQKLTLYRDHQMDFSELSILIAQNLYEAKVSCGILEATALIIAQFVHEGRRYLCALDQGYRKAMSCYIKSDNENEFLEQQVLSPTLLKHDFAFTVELSDLSLHIIEEKRTIADEPVYALATHFLEAQAEASYRESSKEIERLTRTLSEKYEMDPIESLPKVKRLIKEAVSEQENLQVDEIAETLFHEVPFAADEFVSQMAQKGIRGTVSTQSVKMPKSAAMQKLKTDTNIEITFPVEYMEEPDKFEVIHLDDGTIRIEIRNVSHVQSR